MGETAHASGLASSRSQVIGELFRQDAGTVRRLVARRAQVPEVMLEDACQAAWARLWSHDDVSLQRQVVLRWLVVTATRQAWREYGRARSNGSCEQAIAELVERQAAVPDALELVVRHERTCELTARLRALTDRERRFVLMHAAGLSYRDIAALTGSTMRTVERQILRGRRKLREQPPRDEGAAS